MARWKAHAKFLLSVIELLFLSLTVEALQGKMCRNSLPSGVGRSLGAKISGGRGRPWGIFFGFYKTRHILLSNSTNCTVLRAIVLTPYWSVTDGRTDGIAIANTALAMRALRRTVKRTEWNKALIPHPVKLHIPTIRIRNKGCWCKVWLTGFWLVPVGDLLLPALSLVFTT